MPSTDTSTDFLGVSTGPPLDLLGAKNWVVEFILVCFDQIMLKI